MKLRFVWRWIYIASFFLLIAAFAPLLGWVAIIIAVAAVVIGLALRLNVFSTVKSPVMDRIRRIFSAVPVFKPAPQHTGAAAPPKPAKSRIDFSTFNQEIFEKNLNNTLIEQDLFCQRLGIRMLAHFIKIDPKRSLSILVGGPPASGKSGLPEWIGKALEASFADWRGEWPVYVLRCTHDQDIDWAAVREVAAQTPGCIIALDNVEQPLKAGGEHGRFAAGLETLLTQPAFGRCILLLITNAEEASFLKFDQDILQSEQGLASETTGLLKKTFGEHVLKNIEFVTALEPISPTGQLKVIGSMLAEKVREFGLELRDLKDPVRQDQVDEFYIAGTERWSEIGEGGAHMIRKWMDDACRDSLAAARRSGWQSVQIQKWDQSTQKLTFDSSEGVS